MRVALGQINPTVGDIDGNVSKMIEFTTRARQGGADLIVFPELAVPGYPPMDLLLKDSFVQANLKGLARLKEHAQGITVIAGIRRYQLGKRATLVQRSRRHERRGGSGGAVQDAAAHL